VHQDGLVHVSALANRFVKDPHDVVKAGQIVKVKVLEVDVKRQRIALTMRLTDTAESRSQPRVASPGSDARQPRTVPNHSNQGRGDNRHNGRAGTQQPSAMALSFARLKQK
jgi:uncharacterized protein